MKKTFTLILTLCSIGLFAQDNMQNGVILGSMEIGNKQVTGVYNENTGCTHRSGLHTKGLFTVGENVLIDISGNGQNKLVKPNLVEDVYVDKNCDNGNSNVNVVNPYESVGVAHNLILSTIGQVPDFTELSLQQVFEISETVAEKELNGQNPLGYDATMNNLKPIFDADFDEINGSVVSELIGNQPLSTKQRQLIDNLFNKILTAPNETALENSIKNIERSLMVRNDLSNEDKAVVYVSCAVTRHSLEFWLEASVDASNPWYKVINADGDGGNGNGGPQARGFWKRVLHTLLADAAGGLAGYVASFGNPVAAGMQAGIASFVVGAGALEG